jgi:ABC-type transport system substrate-binding protein
LSRHVWIVLLIVLSMFVSIFLVHPVAQNASGQAAPFVINVGVQDEMKTRNLIRGFFFGTDVWTADALNPVAEGTVQTDPETQTVLPYTMVGTDVNGDGKLEANEVGAFSNVQGIPIRASEWIAFYSIKGMRWHDGTQVELEDVLFGYHLASLAPAVTSSRFVKHLAGQAGSNYSSTRYQNINPVPIAGASVDGWLGGPVADPKYQFALKFIQTGPNAGFKRDTLQATFMPAYFWQGTGVRKQGGAIVATNVHPDFGWAMNPDPAASGLSVYLNGIPAAGNTTVRDLTFEGISITAGTHLAAFDVTAASVGCPHDVTNCASPWEAQDQDVIGAGSYKFVHWEAGNFVRLDKNPNYFIPDATVRAKYPSTLDLRVPKVDSIIYRLYRNVQATVFALQAGTLDFIDWTVPPDQVAPIAGDPNIGLKSSADAGFFYQSFNFDRLPFGYLNPAEGSNTPGNDIGKPFRLAVAHATDKRTIVTSLLQNFGVAGHTVVSPTNTLYYNASAPRYEFDLSVARGILDAAYGAWPGGVCQQDGTGCRSLPGKGTSAIDMLTPQADYDPIRASAGTLIAQNMRAIGVNLNAKATAFGAIVDALDARNFDMWILGWSLTGYVEPGYIESFFHSRNAPIPGQNYESYVNTSMDTIIDDATGAVGTQAVQLWKWAQGAILQDAIYNVLYFRTNVFAFRQDRIDPSSFRTDIGGDVWIYWSRLLLDPAPPGVIRSAATIPSAVASGGSAPVTVTVRDSLGHLVVGASVNISRTSGSGTVTPSSGTTNGNGQFVATFLAPTLASGATPESTFLEIQSTSSEFGAARLVTVVITTFPPGAQFLTLLADTPFGNVINEGGAGAIDVTVSDENGLPAVGANVLLSPSPSITLTPSTFTLDATGHQQVTVSAPSVTADTTYTITITATKGAVSGTSQMTIVVLNVPPPQGGGIDTQVLLIGGAVVGTGAAGGVYVGLRRRGRKKP